MTRIFLVLLIVLGCLFGAGAWGTYQWRQESAVAVARLECCAVANPMTYEPAVELKGLPEPVQRYFQHVLRPGQVLIRRTRQIQVGEFQMEGRGWTSLNATQTSVVRSPGFVWDARIGMIPGLVNAQVRDSYSTGNASMTAKVLGLVTMMDVRNGPELASAALQRHLGEAIWFPTALLPSQGVMWDPIDANTARATLTDRDVTVSLDFSFDAAGEITGSFTPARFKEQHGQFIKQPWAAVCSDYAERGGMRIPTRAEVAWIVDGKRVPYWRATISSIEFE